MRILNLYAGIGGNAQSFEGHEVVAVEYNEGIAEVYKKHFPEHEVVVGDALKYLEENFMNFDFIWASPPCPTHSRARKHLAYKTDKDGNKWRQNKPVLPDMSLYSIIVFLQHEEDFKGKYVVENVIPYYEPLIKADKIGRHLFWSNVDLSDIELNDLKATHDSTIKDMEVAKGFDLDGVSIPGIDKRTLLRNAVDKEISDAIMLQVELEFILDSML